MTKRRRFSSAFKKSVALAALRGDKTLQEIAAEYEVHPNQVRDWKRQAIDGMDDSFDNKAGKSGQQHDAEVKELHAKIGQLTMERDFLAQGLKRFGK